MPAANLSIIVKMSGGSLPPNSRAGDVEIYDTGRLVIYETDTDIVERQLTREQVLGILQFARQSGFFQLPNILHDGGNAMSVPDVTISLLDMAGSATVTMTNYQRLRGEMRKEPFDQVYKRITDMAWDSYTNGAAPSTSVVNQADGPQTTPASPPQPQSPGQSLPFSNQAPAQQSSSVELPSLDDLLKSSNLDFGSPIPSTNNGPSLPPLNSPGPVAQSSKQQALPPLNTPPAAPTGTNSFSLPPLGNFQTSGPQRPPAAAPLNQAPAQQRASAQPSASPQSQVTSSIPKQQMPQSQPQAAQPMPKQQPLQVQQAPKPSQPPMQPQQQVQAKPPSQPPIQAPAQLVKTPNQPAQAQNFVAPQKKQDVAQQPNVPAPKQKPPQEQRPQLEKIKQEPAPKQEAPSRTEKSVENKLNQPEQTIRQDVAPATIETSPVVPIKAPEESMIEQREERSPRQHEPRRDQQSQSRNEQQTQQRTVQQKNQQYNQQQAKPIRDERNPARLQMKRPPVGWEHTQELVGRLEESFKGKLLTFYITPGHEVTMEDMRYLYTHLRKAGSKKTLYFMPIIPSGQMPVVWRMATLLREFCQELTVVVPDAASVYTTMLALSADSILMNPLGYLAPIETRFSHPTLETTNPVALNEVLQAAQMTSYTFSAPKTKSSSSTSMEVTTPSAVHPLAVTSAQRQLALTQLLCGNLLRLSKKGPKADIEITRIVQQLTGAYLSSDYPITFNEVKDLGLQVQETTEEMNDLLWDLIRNYTYITQPVVALRDDFKSVEQQAVIMESEGRRTLFYKEVHEDQKNDRIFEEHNRWRELTQQISISQNGKEHSELVWKELEISGHNE